MLRLLTYVCVLFVVTSCAGKTKNDFRVSLGLVSPYEVAQTEFHQGLVMEAHNRLLTIKKDDTDYPVAQALLKQKVEPARLKLLRYYARKGQAEEKKKSWVKAEEAFGMAAELSQQPKALKEYQKNMQLKIRQLRFDSIYEQRQQEDDSWLLWQEAYVPPTGLLGDDEVFAEARHVVSQAVEQYIMDTWRLAEDYKNKDLPELAWLYANSYLSLSAGDKNAQNLKNAMATAVPKGFMFPQNKKKKDEVKVVAVPVKEMSMTPKDVKKLMQQGKWKQAQDTALNLRKEGNAEAGQLLAEIDGSITAKAEKAYNNGNLAFRTEKIDDAVKFWQQAVDLKPNEQIYLDSLRRGQQIQERLEALNTEAEE
ncbi:MAG: hypothetical protein R8M14_03385 [Ghiorsea sp.]